MVETVLAERCREDEVGQTVLVRQVVVGTPSSSISLDKRALVAIRSAASLLLPERIRSTTALNSALTGVQSSPILVLIFEILIVVIDNSQL